MVNPQDILDYVDQLVGRFKPLRVILFGSHAYGLPTENSDVDLLVVMPHGGPSYEAASQIRIALDAAFPLDILVRRPADMRRRLAMGDDFLRAIMEEGILLYDRNHPRMGQQGRRRLQRRLRSTFRDLARATLNLG